MSWGKIDDKLHNHPKFARAGAEAIGVWTMCLSHCCDYLTDGYIARDIVVRFAGGEEAADRVAARLIGCGTRPGDAGLWEIADGGWQMHDYSDYNPSRAKVLAEREAERLRKESGRKNQGRDKDGRIGPKRSPKRSPKNVRAESDRTTTGTDQESGRTADGLQPDSKNVPPVPIPIPIRDPEEKNKHAGARVIALEPTPDPVPGWFTKAWMHRAGVAFLGTDALRAPWECVRAYAAATEKTCEEVTRPLFDAYERVCADWDGKHRWAPHLFVKHFDIVQSELARPTKSRSDRETKDWLAEQEAKIAERYQ
jgi:hypothetical protein